MGVLAAVARSVALLPAGPATAALTAPAALDMMPAALGLRAPGDVGASAPLTVADADVEAVGAPLRVTAGGVADEDEAAADIDIVAARTGAITTAPPPLGPTGEGGTELRPCCCC